MTQSLASLHPNPGWNAHASTTPISDSIPTSISLPPAAAASAPVGKHCILELYHCNPAKLDDEAVLRSIISTAVQRAGATLLHLITHHFEPQGVTGLALLAESHLSIHTWPESGYAAVDVFTCGDHTMPERACMVLREELEAAEHSLRSFRRETPADLGNQPRLVG